MVRLGTTSVRATAAFRVTVRIIVRASSALFLSYAKIPSTVYYTRSHTAAAS
jgi:hypothetical protein